MAAALEDPAELARLARASLESGDELAVEPVLAAAVAKRPDDPTLRHWLALLQRGLDRRDEALNHLSAARRLDPRNALLAHAQAHVALEAGVPAVELFETALRLAPSQPEIRLGLAAARFAVGQGEQALRELEAALSANPGWYEGYRKYAQLAALLGKVQDAVVPLQRALGKFPDSEPLYEVALELLLNAERFHAALELAKQGMARVGAQPSLQLAHAAALDELGHLEKAEFEFERLGVAMQVPHAQRRLRHLLRTDRHDEAAAELESWLQHPQAEVFWPYAALIWRLVGDERSEWLEGSGEFFAVIDLPYDGADLQQLGDTLRAMHAGAGQFMDQSVRGGTQTDGPLFAKLNPAIVQLRERVRKSVAEFIARLPSADPAHPLLSQRRDKRPRFAGSWSVRLAGTGCHESHHHPEGWISAVFYAAVPDDLSGEEGHLVLGEAPSNLKLGLRPRAVIAPRPGRLVIFPSTMWHATRPFPGGERLTVACDVAR